MFQSYLGKARHGVYGNTDELHLMGLHQLSFALILNCETHSLK